MHSLEPVCRGLTLRMCCPSRAYSTLTRMQELRAHICHPPPPLPPILQYCTHIVFYILLKAEGRPVKDHPVITRLVELRAYMEKIRPIDKRLQYQGLREFTCWCCRTTWPPPHAHTTDMCAAGTLLPACMRLGVACHTPKPSRMPFACPASFIDTTVFSQQQLGAVCSNLVTPFVGLQIDRLIKAAQIASNSGGGGKGELAGDGTAEAAAGAGDELHFGPRR
eukprot:356232-Chlamydomonas_euryale.AAC.16